MDRFTVQKHEKGTMDTNLLQLHRGPVYPPSNGEETRIWKTAEKLSEQATLWLAHPCDPTTTLPSSIKSINIGNPLLEYKTTRIYLWNAVLSAGSENWYDRAQTRLTVRTVLKDVPSAEAVFCESPQVLRAGMQLAEEYDAKLILNKHNAMYSLLDQQLSTKPIPQLLRSRAVQALREFEQQGINAADAVVYQSDDDARLFSHPPDTLVKTIPNGCDFNRLNSGGDPEQVRMDLGLKENRPICVFIGAYDYEPNAKAAELIIEQIAPSLPFIDFLLVGRDPPTRSPENVYAPGYVDDLAGTLQLADIAICPLTMGSGTKLKMLDYLAAGLPIVTTPIGAQGLPVEDGETALICDDIVSFIEGISTLYKNDELAEHLAQNATDLGRQYSWDRLLSKYDNLFDELQLSMIHP